MLASNDAGQGLSPNPSGQFACNPHILQRGWLRLQRGWRVRQSEDLRGAMGMRFASRKPIARHWQGLMTRGKIRHFLLGNCPAELHTVDVQSDKRQGTQVDNEGRL